MATINPSFTPIASEGFHAISRREPTIQDNEMNAAMSQKQIKQDESIAKIRPIVSCRSVRKARGCFNAHIISLAFISYILSNQMAILILGSTSPVLRKGDVLMGQDYDISENMIDSKTHAYKLSSFERSLVQLVAASPAPMPVPAASRSSTSISHRVPPMNGSIFGKRSLGSNQKKTRQAGEWDSSTRTSSKGANNYPDIVTELIESFMSRNNEGKCHESLLYTIAGLRDSSSGMSPED